MNTEELVPGKVWAVVCSDGAVMYAVKNGLGEYIPASIVSLSPSDLRVIASHKEGLLDTGFRHFT